jgi:hypothetical protein
VRWLSPLLPILADRARCRCFIRLSALR